MNHHGRAYSERGATLVVALIMLLLFTLLVSGAWNLSMVNLKAVGNIQMRDEAIAAANMAIDEVLKSDFTSTSCPPGFTDSDACVEDVLLDINNDGVDDYTARVAKLCVQEKVVLVPAGACQQSLLPMCQDPWLTVWELRATVTDPASGAYTAVRSGVNMILTTAERTVRCI